MYSRIGDRAENPKEDVLKHADEFIPLCERILSECTDNKIRFEASHILASIYNAKGESGKAIACFDGFPNFYDAREQRIEQLYIRGTEEWWKQINENMATLTTFALNKIGRVIWYSDKPIEWKAELTERFVTFIEGVIETTGYGFAYSHIANLYEQAGSWLRRVENYDLLSDYYDKLLDNEQKYEQSDCEKKHEYRFKAVYDWMCTTPWLAELRETEKFQRVLSKYK
jgi:hypothetical protein